MSRTKKRQHNLFGFSKIDNDKKEKVWNLGKGCEKDLDYISILSGDYSLGQNKEDSLTFFSGHSFVWLRKGIELMGGK